MTDRTTVVIPLYRSADTVAELHRRLRAEADRTGRALEVCLVDDASGDGTWDAMVALLPVDARLSVVRLAANVRQVRAILAGMEVAGDSRYVVMDGDLEDPPEAVGALLDALDGGHDLVIARRVGRRRPLGRRVGSTAANLLVRLAGAPSADIGSSMLAMERPIADTIRRELDETGSQLVLPAMVEAARSATSVAVAPGHQAPSRYPARALVGIGIALVRSQLARPLGRRLLGIAALVGVLAGRRRAPGLGLVAAAMALLGAAGASGRLRPRRDRSEPLYEIAEVRGLRATERP